MIGGLFVVAAPVLAVGANKLSLSISSAASPDPTFVSQSFSWGVSQPSPRARGAVPTASSCPSTSDSGRWIAPDVPPSSARSSSSSSAVPPGAVCVAVVVAPRDSSTGMASGRKGWDGCMKGGRYAVMNIVHRDIAYRMTDVTVTECTADGMVLSFDKVSSSAFPRPAITLSGRND